MSVVIHGFDGLFLEIFLRKDDGFLYSDTETKAEILNDQFHSVYTREDMTSMPEKGQSPSERQGDCWMLDVGHLS
jgi:hypothetical protein